MSWFTDNKFTAVFGGITAVIAGGLGWLVIEAKGDLETKQSAFADKTAELKRLQDGKPFPNDKNAAAYKAEFGRVEAELSKLHQRLAATEFPLETVDPRAFQDRLKQTVDRIKLESIAKKMLLPGQKKEDGNAVAADQTFNLGFDYLGSPPQDEASSELARELKVVEFVIQQLLTNGATDLLEIKRSHLQSEKGEKTAKKEEKKPATGSKKEKSEDEPKLVTHHKFEVKFVAPQSSFMKVLNGIASAPQPFIIPRRVIVKNEKTEGPLKEVPGVASNQATEPPAGTPPDPNAPAAQATGASGGKDSNKINYIVGEEKLVVELELEMVDFADAKAETEAKAKTSK